MDMADMLIVYTYAVYLVVSIGLTVWVAHTLHKNGRIFLVEAFAGNIETLSSKIGIVLLVLGGMHFFNLAIFSNMRKRALGEVSRAPAVPGPHPLMGTGR